MVGKKGGNISSIAVPLLLLALVLFSFFQFGPIGLLKTVFPPVEKAFIEKVTLQPGWITVSVFNDGPDETTVSQVLVNDAYNAFEMAPSQTLKPRESAAIKIPYQWIDAEPLKITLLTASGLTVDKEIEAAFSTPTPDGRSLVGLTAIGFYVGILPVLLGVLWFDFLRRLKKDWYNFILSFTLGLLFILGVEAFSEAFELGAQVSSSFQATSLIVIGFFLALLALFTLTKEDEKTLVQRSASQHMLKLSYAIALAIGLHNLGEGLAIGSAFALGEISLGTMFIVGFLIHNITEGIAIVTPIVSTEVKNLLKHLAILVLIAGAPVILGIWLGSFNFNPALAVLLFAIAAGAVFQVIIAIFQYMSRTTEDIFTPKNAAGFLIGLLLLYAIGFFTV